MKANEAIDTIKKMRDLIRVMDYELTLMRTIIQRYHIRYGEILHDGKSLEKLPDNVDIRATFRGISCKLLDNPSGMGAYAQIKKQVAEIL